MNATSLWATGLLLTIVLVADVNARDRADVNVALSAARADRLDFLPAPDHMTWAPTSQVSVTEPAQQRRGAASFSPSALLAPQAELMAELDTGLVSPTDVNNTTQRSGQLRNDDRAKLLWFICAILVFVMQVGFLLLETGNVCTRSMTGIALKNFIMLLASSLLYSLIGFAIMYGKSFYLLFGGYTDYLAFPTEWVFYQTGFAAVAATILSGAIAERTTLRSNVIPAAVIALIVFPVYGHWVWGGGWLHELFAVHDFAGSAVVHLVGGTAAGIGAYITGPRRNWDFRNPAITEDSKSLPLATCGVLFLWLGWMGFNGGSKSENIHTGEHQAGLYALWTCTAASAGGFAAIGLAALTAYVRNRRSESPLSMHVLLGERLLFDAFGLLSGTMGGMVAVTAVCDLLTSSLQASLVGAVGGGITYIASYVVRAVFRLDDPVDAVAVHAGAGCTGMFLVPFFTPDKPFWEQMWSQFIAVAAAILWVLIVMVPVYLLMRGRFDEKEGRYTGFLRCTEDDELQGLSFLPTTVKPQPFPFRTRYLGSELREDIREFLSAIVAGPIHRLDSLKRMADNDARDVRISRALQEEIAHLTILGRLGGRASSTPHRVVSEGIARRGLFSRVLTLVGHLRGRVTSVRVETLFDATVVQPVSLRNVVKDLIVFFKGDSKYHAITWRSPAEVENAYNVPAQYDLITDAVRALMSNAAEATQDRFADKSLPPPPNGPTVECRLSYFGTRCVLDIIDNGCGVPLRVQRRLFEPFNTRKRGGEGHGLGLFYAEFIAQCYGGYVQLVTTARNEGSVFRLYLPRYDLKYRSVSQAGESADAGGG